MLPLSLFWPRNHKWGGHRDEPPRAALQRTEESGDRQDNWELWEPPQPEQSGLGVDGEVAGHAGWHLAVRLGLLFR